MDHKKTTRHLELRIWNCGMQKAELLMSNNEHQILNQSTLRYDGPVPNDRIDLRLVNSDF